MRLIGILFVLCFNVLEIENRMLPIYYETEAPITDRNSVTESVVTNDESKEKAIMAKAFDEEEFELEQIKVNNVIPKKPCAIVVLSNIQNPSMQSLLRKYKYDANGILIPSSVKYFIKLPQSLKSPSVLMPLNDKAFSPLGGFVSLFLNIRWFCQESSGNITEEAKQIPHLIEHVLRNKNISDLEFLE